MDDQTKEMAREVASEVLKKLEPRMQMHFENVEHLVKVSAEGYGASLEKIERELAELNKTVDSGFRDHGVILKNHNERLTKLEQSNA